MKIKNIAKAYDVSKEEKRLIEEAEEGGGSSYNWNLANFYSLRRFTRNMSLDEKFKHFVSCKVEFIKSQDTKTKVGRKKVDAKTEFHHFNGSRYELQLVDGIYIEVPLLFLESHFSFTKEIILSTRLCDEKPKGRSSQSISHSKSQPFLNNSIKNIIEQCVYFKTDYILIPSINSSDIADFGKGNEKPAVSWYVPISEHEEKNKENALIEYSRYLTESNLKDKNSSVLITKELSPEMQKALSAIENK